MKRWRVQAFLLAGPAEPYPYQPTYHRWRWQANRQIRELERSFAPGAVKVQVERSDSKPLNSPTPTRYWLSDGSPGGPWGPFDTPEDRDRQAEMLREVAEWNRHAMQVVRERHPELFE